MTLPGEETLLASPPGLWDAHQTLLHCFDYGSYMPKIFECRGLFLGQSKRACIRPAVAWCQRENEQLL